FPLPADQLLTVTLREAAPISLLTWTAASGRSMEIPFVQQQDRLQLDVSGIPSGTYWVLVEQAGRRYRARVLVAH
ncbi:MAG: T9SS type A sorting domain-containing protein, partial [Flavobacteriales bacterium]|nr:T9SS type A sorting domain-containing protein [Flavobacteriales bacterium]